MNEQLSFNFDVHRCTTIDNSNCPLGSKPVRSGWCVPTHSSAEDHNQNLTAVKNTTTRNVRITQQ